MIAADRHWLLTWTTYGTWLPGDDRGSVVDSRPHRQNTPAPRTCPLNSTSGSVPARPKPVRPST